MSIVAGAIRANPDLTFCKLKVAPAPRICYEIKSRYPKVSHIEAIETLEAGIRTLVEQDQNIYTFQEWMLEDQHA